MMNREQRELKAGEKVFVGRPGSWGTHFTLAEVVKVTPSGLVDVAFGDGKEFVTRFDKNWREQGVRYNGSFIDTCTFEDRTAALEQEKRARQAAQLINAVKPSELIRPTWGKENLQKEVEKLQALLDAARTAVEAI